MADRAGRPGLPRRNILAIRSNQGLGLASQTERDHPLCQRVPLPIIDPTAAAYLSAFSEHLLPVFLVLGLAARFAAFGLLFMTVVIEIFVYSGAWPTHGVWATCFFLLIARGPGEISIDHLIARHFRLAHGRRR